MSEQLNMEKGEAGIMPEPSNNFLAQISFYWLVPVLKAARQATLLPENLFSLRREYTSEHNAEIFITNWDKEIKERTAAGKKPRLWRTILFGMGGFSWFYTALILYTFKIGFSVCQPVFFLYLLKFYVELGANAGIGIGYVIGLTSFIICGVIFDHQYQWKSQRALVQVRAGLLAAIYRKAMKLSIYSEDDAGLSAWVNAMAVDAENVKALVDIFAGLCLIPLEVLGILGLMYSIVYEATFAGLAILIICVLLTRWTGGQISKNGREKSKVAGQKTNLFTEIVNGMKAIKFFAWETEYIKRIEELRQKELDALRRMGNWIVTSFSVSLGSPTLVTGIVFIVYVLQFGKLEVAGIYPTLILLGMLRSLLYNLPQYQARYISASVSLKRLVEYFLLPEIPERNLSDPSLPARIIKMTKSSFDWKKNSENPVLKDLSFQVNPGSLVAVIGEVGSGKSSFVLSILGEMPQVGGERVICNGRVAYVPQQAWIMNATVKENILFGHKFDPEKYNKVLEVCCLKTDLTILEKGDQTVIGDRGINLSGGQRQRISIARAVYSDPDIYLLDDPLSAVDSHVGKALFHDCINGMMKGKTRILVTNQTQYVPFCEEVIQLANHSIAISGKIPDILPSLNLDGEQAKGKDGKVKRSKTKKGTKGSKKDKKDKKVKKEKKEKKEKEEKEEVGEDEGKRSRKNSMNELSLPKEAQQSEDELEVEEENNETKENGESEEEEREEEVQVAVLVPDIGPGETITDQRKNFKKMNTNFSVFRTQTDDAKEEKEEKEKKKKKKEASKDKPLFPLFVRAIGGWGGFIYILLVQLLCALGVMAQSIFLQLWAGGTIPLPSKDDLGIFASLCLSYVFFQFFRTFYFSRATQGTAKKIHSSILHRVLRAPMSFFDTTPTGEILAWFTKDMFLMDLTMHTTLEITFVIAFPSLIYLIFIPLMFPWVLIFFVPFIAVLYTLASYYGPALVQVKNLDATTCPPIYSHFKETLDGLASIRAYQAQVDFRNESARKIDINNRVIFHLYSLDHWLGFGIDMSGNVFALVMCILIVLSKYYNHILTNLLVVPSSDPQTELISKGAAAAISLYLCVSVTTTINLFLRNLVESSRILERYAKLIEVGGMAVEAPAIIETNRPRPTWPENGELVFDKLFIKYRPDLDFVLRDVTCKILPKEKIGVIGRTGAGKSSLMSALFRLLEFSSGTVLLDGVDISKIGLDDLRSKLAIINQDPVLFSGTVRSNLDPFSKFSDEEIWHAIDLAMMKDVIEGLEGKLEAKVAANGENFSVGQRQQFALARAMLRSPKVMVMDEATSSIDNDTDALIQRAIRVACKDTTVMTIAHRLNTIMDSDRVMVLDRGRIVEFDRPSVLLGNPNSHFTSMVEATGPASAKRLRKMIKH